jgi:hypothetical protein
MKPEGNPSMLTKSPLPLASIVAAALLVTGCSAASARQDPAPAVVQAVPGSNVQQVRLTEQAIHRLGITTVPVRTAKASLDGQRGTHKLIPYSAVVYDNDGSTWTFVNIGPQTFIRQRITVGAIQGSTAVLVKGPALGAAVVTVGAPELLGTEYNISGEE